MQLTRLTVKDYRNLADASVDLGPGFTVLYGHNGAGKTNLLEAIYLVSTLRSFRSSDLGVLIREGTEGARVELRGHDPTLDVATTLEVRLQRRGSSTRRIASADGKVIRSGAQFYGRVRAVLFTPEDLGVLRGSPTGRRQFLDRVLFARDRGHITDVQTYDKLLRSRNRVLRQADEPGERTSPAQRTELLATYEVGLAQVGARLWTRRVELLDDLHERFAAAFTAIHGEAGEWPEGGEAGERPEGGEAGERPEGGEAGERPEGTAGSAEPGASTRHVPRASLRYACKLGEVPADQREAALRDALLQRRDLDLRRGTTSVGPHRDDLTVELDGHPAGSYASQGQSRALVLAFKLAEVQAARERDRVPPLLLLDDVSSELDPRRTALLFRTLGELVGQCVLTTTAPHFIDLPAHVRARRFRVDRGTVSPHPPATD